MWARVARFEGDPQTVDAAMTAGQPRNAGTRTSVEFYEVAGEVTL